jgi:DME family drug/metabolite transporter
VSEAAAETEHPFANRGRILGAAALFSTGGAAIKACSYGGWQVACFRSGIAAIAVALMVPQALKALTWRSWLVATTYAATLTLFVTANKLTTSANTIFLQSTAPLYLVLLGPWLLKDRVRPRDVAFMVAMAGGLALFFVGDQARFETAPNPLKGNVLAVLSGFAWALTVIGLRWSGRHEEGRPGAGAAAVVAGNALAFVFCLAPSLPADAPSLKDALLLLHLGILQIGLAYVLLTKALRHVPALEASLLLLFEPMLNPFWAWWFQGERPGPFALAGCAIIFAATVVKTVADARRR